MRPSTWFDSTKSRTWICVSAGANRDALRQGLILCSTFFEAFLNASTSSSPLIECRTSRRAT